MQSFQKFEAENFFLMTTVVPAKMDCPAETATPLEWYRGSEL